MNERVFYFYRDPGKRDSRAHVAVRAEGVFLRVDDDYYDCELDRETAIELAREILDRCGE